MDGLGEVMTFVDPPVGEGWTITVPSGKRWRLWGGSCRLAPSAAAGNRLPYLAYRAPNGAWVWFSTQIRAVSASSPRYIAYYEASVWHGDLWVATFLPIALKAIWLPPGTEIIGGFGGLQAGDQVSQLGFLVEQDAA